MRQSKRCQFCRFPHPFLYFTVNVLLEIRSEAERRTQMVPSSFCGDVDCCLFKDAPSSLLLIRLYDQPTISSIRIVSKSDTATINSSHHALMSCRASHPGAWSANRPCLAWLTACKPEMSGCLLRAYMHTYMHTCTCWCSVGIDWKCRQRWTKNPAAAARLLWVEGVWRMHIH